MGTIGQIVYNLEDYQTSGGYVSTSRFDGISSLIKTQDIYNDADYVSARIDIFQDVIKAFNLGAISKLGIQAPPGTKFLLDGKKFLMGRTGVYEMDEDIKVKSLQFEEPKNYIIDEQKTQEALNKGIAGFQMAENQRRSEMEALEKKEPPYDIPENYWARYKEIQDQYNEQYNMALGYYNSGINGYFKEQGTKTLYNVIIDFIYDK